VVGYSQAASVDSSELFVNAGHKKIESSIMGVLVSTLFFITAVPAAIVDRLFDSQTLMASVSLMAVSFND